MNFEHLRTFKELAGTGSFSEAAKKLRLTQPAVSFQVQRLEQELGVQLIDRSQRGAALTEAGKKLLRFAEAVGGEYERLQYELGKMQQEISGELRLAASTIPGEYILPPLLAEFKKLHPAVTIQVDISDSVTVINQVHDNTYEAGFCGIVPAWKDLEYFKVAGDEIVLIVPAEHPFANRDAIMPGELAGEPFIFREATSGTQRSLEALLTKSGFDTGKLTPHLTLGSTHAVLAAVAAGAGIAFVSSLAIKNECSSTIKKATIHCLQLKRDFYFIYRRDRVLPRLYEEFKNFIQITNTRL